MAKILLVEPFFGGSHQQWAEGWQQNSEHQIELLTLSAHHWKWRMHGAAVTLAMQFMEMDFQPDWIVASDMLDLASFLSLSRPKSDGVATAVYFHENQLTYPWSSTDKDKNNQRDNHYKFINYTSALSADICLFNSNYHKNSFLEALPPFLKLFPDHKNLNTVAKIIKKSQVLSLGLDLKRLNINKEEIVKKHDSPILLWNHRWEYDKNPSAFFSALFELKNRNINFNLVVLGEELSKRPPIFDEAKKRLKNETLHWGFCQKRADYTAWLWQADILPVTSNQDFFGGSIIEAVYCNTIPLLPKRLAYPEHFPNNSAFYYENEEEFIETLATLINKWSKEHEIKLQGLVKKYDWQELIGTYDEIFKTSHLNPT